MKIKNIVTVLLIAFILTSCTPAATVVVPTQTAIPTSTSTSIPPTTTITPTPLPEDLIEAKDISTWIDNYVNAYDGKVVVNSTELDSNQLLIEVKSNPDTYIRETQINGISYLFFLINDVPLAFREGGGQWKELTSRNIIEIFRQPDDTFKYFGVQFSNPFSANISYRIDDVLATEFNAAFLNDAYWHVIEQREGFPNFKDSLDAATKAKQNGMFVIGGQLVDPRGEFEYTFLKKKKDLTHDELLAIMTKHISMEVEALKGNIDLYIVVNEHRPVTATIEGKPEDPFNAIIGEDYLDIAFQTARDTDPNAILIYNDNSNYHPAHDYTNGSNNTSDTLEIVNRLKSKGLIDGVGLQMHLFADEPPNVDKMIKTFQAYGVPVYVTELDINMDGISGTEVEKKRLQEKLYQDVLAAILQTNVTVMVSHWNAVETWDGQKGQLFDNQLRPTRNLYIERKVLFSYYQNR